MPKKSKETLAIEYATGAKGSPADFEEFSLDETAYVLRRLKEKYEDTRDAAVRSNIGTASLALRGKIKNGTVMYYCALESGFPYQESSKFGAHGANAEEITIRIFEDKDECDIYADFINKRVSAARRSYGLDSKKAVHTEYIGFDSGLDAVGCMQRFGVKTVIIGRDADGEEDFTVSLAPMTVIKNIPNLYIAAPETRMLLGLYEQALAEGRETDADHLKDLALMMAGTQKLLVPISAEDYENNRLQPIMRSYNDGVMSIPVFTDWAELKHVFVNEDVYAALLEWDRIGSYGEPVVLNETIIMNGEAVQSVGDSSEKSQMALFDIMVSYELSSSRKEDSEKAYGILKDIKASSPIWKEYSNGLYIYHNEEFDSDVVACSLPRANPIKVNGYTAEMLVASKLCENPAKAYHVLSLLDNDPTGKNAEAFERAELSE